MPILLMNRYCNFLCNTESIHHELTGCKNVIADSKLDSRFIPRSRLILTIPLFFPQKIFFLLDPVRTPIRFGVIRELT